MLWMWVQREMGEKRAVLPQSFKSGWGKSQKGSRLSKFDGKRNIRIGRLTCLPWQPWDLILTTLGLHVQSRTLMQWKSNGRALILIWQGRARVLSVVDTTPVAGGTASIGLAGEAEKALTASP